MSNTLLDRLMVIFGAPESDDPRLYLDEVGKLLAKYTPEVLDRAADILIRTHKRNSFPKPSDIVTVCEDVLSMKTISAPLPPKHPEWTPERVKLADKLIVSDMGRIAADEGWILSLHDFCRKKSRLPSEHEIDRIKRDARGFDDAYGLVCGKPDAISIKLKQLGKTMLERRNRYAEMAHGVVT